MIAVLGSSAFFCPTYPLPSWQRVRPRRLTKEKLGFNFELEQLERYPSRRSRHRYKGRCNHCTRRGRWKKLAKSRWQLRGGGRSRQPHSSLSRGGTLENKNNPAQRGMCEKEREREGQKGRAREGETPDGGSVTNGDAAATCEAKVPAFVARLYVRDGHKFRPLPIKPWKWEPGQNNRGLRVSRGTLRHFRIRRSLSPSSLSLSSSSLSSTRRLWQVASPRAFLTILSRFFRSLILRVSSPFPRSGKRSVSVRRLEKSKRREPYCPCERKICNLVAYYYY